MREASAGAAIDVIVLGSGAAGLTAALRAAMRGLRVVVLEKADVLGGTSAMSGGGVWIPANHVARAAGIEDSPMKANAYLDAALPEQWNNADRALRRAFVEMAPEMLAFVEEKTPLRFAMTDEPDPLAELPGGLTCGRMVSPLPLPRRLAGRFARKLRPSTYPNLFTYQELLERDPWHYPVRATVGLAGTLLARVLTGRRGQGMALVIGLVRGCLDHGCVFFTGARATSLLRDGYGRVTGVACEHKGEHHSLEARRGVVIATGGFEWNESWLDRHFPGARGFTASPRTNTGDGHRLALEAGAWLDRLDQANIYPTLPTRYEGQVHGIPVLFQLEPHAIVVNRFGQRFTSEYSYNIGEALDERDPMTGEPVHIPAWLIGDARVCAAAPLLRWFVCHAPGHLRKAATLVDLARQIRIDPARLGETVARYNGFCRSGRDADFHRGESTWEQYKAGGPRQSLGTIERAPFIALPFNRAILGTKGGPRVNEHGQVLRRDGNPIPGLYCCGNAMANPFGTRSIGAGTTLGPCMTWGYICAEALAREASEPPSRPEETGSTGTKVSPSRPKPIDRTAMQIVDWACVAWPARRDSNPRPAA